MIFKNGRPEASFHALRHLKVFPLRNLHELQEITLTAEQLFGRENAEFKASAIDLLQVHLLEMHPDSREFSAFRRKKLKEVSKKVEKMTKDDQILLRDTALDFCRELKVRNEIVGIIKKMLLGSIGRRKAVNMLIDFRENPRYRYLKTYKEEVDSELGHAILLERNAEKKKEIINLQEKLQVK